MKYIETKHCLVLVDEEDFSRIIEYARNQNAKWESRIYQGDLSIHLKDVNGKDRRMSRFIMNVLDNSEVNVLHKNRDQRDLRKENLIVQ